LELQWRDSVGTGDATPVLAGDRLYVFTRQGDQETLLCLKAVDGSEVWKYAYPAPEVTGAASRHPGPRSTPVVSQGKIVTLGATGIVSCLDSEDGSLLWKKDPFPGVVPMFFTSMSPLVEENVCILFLGGTGNGALLAYDLATGEEKWRWDAEGPDYGSPVLLSTEGTIQVVTPTEKSIVGVNVKDGMLLWSVPFVPERRAYNAATPIVSGNRIIYSGAGRGTTAIQIEKQGDAFTTRELWFNPDASVQFSSEVLKDGLIFGYSSSGSLFCLDAVNGKTAWADTVKHDRSGFAALLDVGPAVMALPASGELILFKPQDNGYGELARVRAADLPVYAHPVVSGSRIFIRDERTVALWILK
jgi:outer membrane protein assembly factor BamB